MNFFDRALKSWIRENESIQRSLVILQTVYEEQFCITYPKRCQTHIDEKEMGQINILILNTTRNTELKITTVVFDASVVYVVGINIIFSRCSFMATKIYANYKRINSIAFVNSKFQNSKTRNFSHIEI